MRRKSAGLFVGLTLFAAGGLVGTSSLDVNQALAQSRGFSTNTSQSRTTTGGYRPGSLSQTKGQQQTGMRGTYYPGNTRTGASPRIKTNLERAKGPLTFEQTGL